MKYAGALALAGAAVMAAVCVNLRKKRRAALFAQLSEFFTALASFSEIAPRDAAETVGRLARTRDFRLLGFLTPFADRCQNGDVREAWRRETASFPGAALLNGEEQALLSGFADHFGLTSLSAFTQVCRRYAEAFAGYHVKEKRNYEETGRLTAGVGVLAAALIVIALL